MPVIRIVTPRSGAGKFPAPTTNGTGHNGTSNGHSNGTSGRRIVRVRRRLDLPDNLVATDSEWDVSQAGDAWLSTAFATPAGARVVCVRADLPPSVRNRLVAKAEALGVHLLFVRRTDNTDLLTLAVPHLGQGVLRSNSLDLANFFSPKDFEYALGWRNWRHALHEGAIHQRHALIGRVGMIRLRDLKGWAGKSTLAKFAAALGVPTPAKTTMDDFKECMRRGLEERPEDFLYYAIEDARILLDLFARFVAFVQQIQRDVLGMTDALLWHADDIPMTLGRLVASTFERWLFSQAGEHGEALRFCIRKLGFLNPRDPNYPKAHKVRALLLDRVRRVEDLGALAADPKGGGLLRKFLRDRYLFTALDACSVRWWLSRATTETAGLNALVHGGRCNNERPDEYQCGPGLDIDIAKPIATLPPTWRS
jgi:hypothetical protein